MPAGDTKVYIGDLGSNASKHDIEDAFTSYGRLTSVWVARNPPGFAFVEFEDPRDADDAVRALDGRFVCCHCAFLFCYLFILYLMLVNTSRKPCVFVLETL